eukprot:TRINITY_DN1527_c0_g1_i4.p1 TRINITY_DN1527_c0_g1~~TRINITY_DN1527_c0_g1_i4.p1  ORF type:complete len:877 (+),score=163.57 TRINITY_DN1527_c0_g1_i4:49-2679(+)
MAATGSRSKRRYTRAELLAAHQATARPPECMGCFEHVGSLESLQPVAMQPKREYDDTADDRFSFRDRHGGRRPSGDVRRRANGPAWMDEPAPRQPMTFDRRGIFSGQEAGRESGLASRDAGPPVSKNAARWEYRDKYEKVQGPFTDDQMFDWHKRGHFFSALPVRVVGESSFAPLGKLAEGAPEGTDFFKAYVRSGQGRPEHRAGAGLEGRPLQRWQPEPTPMSAPDPKPDAAAVTTNGEAPSKPAVRTSRLGKWSSAGSNEAGKGVENPEQAKAAAAQVQQQQMQQEQHRQMQQMQEQQMQQLQQMQQQQMQQRQQQQQQQQMQQQQQQQQMRMQQQQIQQQMQQQMQQQQARMQQMQQQVHQEHSHQQDLKPGSTSVLHALRQDKSVSLPEPPAPLSSFFDNAPQNTQYELEPTQQRSARPGVSVPNNAQTQPQQPMMQAEDFEQRMMASARANGSRLPQAHAAQSHPGAVGAPGGLTMPQMPGTRGRAGAPAPVPLSEIMAQEQRAPKPWPESAPVQAPVQKVERRVEVAPNEQAWGGAKKSTQPTSMRDIQQKQQVAEKQRQTALRQQQQQSGFSSSGWHSQQKAAPSLRDIMAQEQSATTVPSVPAKAPAPATAPESEDLGMFWDYQGDEPAPSAAPAKPTVQKAVSKAPVVAAPASDDFPALGAQKRVTRPKPQIPHPAVQVPKQVPKPAVGRPAPTQVAKPAAQAAWMTQSEFPSLGGKPRGGPGPASTVPSVGQSTWQQSAPVKSTAGMQDLEKWCQSELEKFNQRDITFVYLLCSQTSPEDVRSQIRKQVGSSQAASKFADDFILMHGQCTGKQSARDSVASGNQKEPQSAPGKKGKKKKKGGKVDASLLGFGVSAGGRILENEQTL